MLLSALADPTRSDHQERHGIVSSAATPVRPLFRAPISESNQLQIHANPCCSELFNTTFAVLTSKWVLQVVD